MIWLALLLVVIGALWTLHKWNYHYWTRKGIPSPNPKPIFGNFLAAITMSQRTADIYDKIYNDFSHLPYVGFYRFLTPALMVRDPELVRTVLVKEFDSFHDNGITVDPKVDPLGAKHPFITTGDAWKKIRSQVSPCFSSAKTKQFLPLILEVCQDLITYVKQESEVSNALEAKELAAKYTTDVVASCAFGLKAESFTNPNAMFRKMGRKIFEPTTLNSLKLMIITLFPKLAHIIRVGFIPKDVGDWMRKVVSDTLKYREVNGVAREDFLQSMCQLKTKPGSDSEFTDEDVTAQSITFYVDGFETSSYAISFALYEMAANPGLQKRLRNEMTSVLSKHEGKITYEAIAEMKYLDAILNETLRKYPPGDGFTRLCTKEFTFPPIDGTGGAGLTVEVGTPVFLPLYSLHRDPQYYPDPAVFNPDRFMDEDAKLRYKNVFYPFSEGPRKCLGFRFALMQVKACMISLITQMELTVDSRTQEPIQMDPKALIPAALGGMWIQYNPIK